MSKQNKNTTKHIGSNYSNIQTQRQTGTIGKDDEQIHEIQYDELKESHILDKQAGEECTKSKDCRLILSSFLEDRRLLVLELLKEAERHPQHKCGNE